MFLTLKNTDIGYDTPLVKGVEAALEIGEICLLIGNNGVGKTTLIKSILNQIPLLKGEIELQNQSLPALNNSEISRHISIVFSKSQIPPNYTVTDLVSLGKYIHYPYYFALDKTDQVEVQEIIESLNLSEYKDFPLNKLSDGNLQKAFIGRALAQNSPMIILDEPTTHLDEKNKITILKLLRDLAKKHNRLILFSSHDWRLAKEFADKIWLINNGILDAGITEDILLKHNELLNAELFHFNENFVAPHISAPSLEGEMLYSFLQKNFNKNLSAFTFKFENEIWIFTKGENQYLADTFGDIAKILSKFN